MKKLLLPLAGALLIISGLSGCQSTELVSGMPTPSVVTESTAADSSGEPGATSENSEADGQIQSTEQSVTVESPAEDSGTPEQRAAEILSGMTAAEKAGQVILARYPGENALSEAQKFHLGGYVMFGVDFRGSTPEEITAEIAEIQSASKLRMLFAADEEGGTVVRVSKYTAFRDEPFSSPQVLYGRGGAELLEIDAKEKAELLTSLGINLNLAPVADISEDENSYIYPRTMGQDPEHTAEAVAAIVSASADRKLASCLKHFPGYGENTDTHKGMAHDSRELYEFYNRDFLPFSAGINAVQDKTPAVMVGHTIYYNIDPDYPASLSSAIHEVLRDKLEFDGVAITDDMGMDAIKDYAGDGSVYVKAILADNDMICVTDYETAYNDLKAAYESGELSDDIIDSHVRRILIMKLEYGIIK